MEYFSATKRNEVRIHGWIHTGMSPENIVLTERSQTQKATYCMIPLSEMSQTGKSRETEGGLAFVRDCEKERRGITANEQRFSFGGWWKCLELDRVMNVWVCQDAKKHWTVHFIRVNFTLCELYLHFFWYLNPKGLHQHYISTILPKQQNRSQIICKDVTCHKGSTSVYKDMCVHRQLHRHVNKHCVWVVDLWVIFIFFFLFFVFSKFSTMSQNKNKHVF